MGRRVNSNVEETTANANGANVEEVAGIVQGVNLEDIVDDDDVDETDDNGETDDDDAGFEGGSIFEQIMQEVGDSERSQDDIIKECLLDKKHFSRASNLNITNVVATAYHTYTMLTFVVKQFVFGTVYDDKNLDEFGNPTAKLGRSHNIFTSAYAVSAIMKNSAKQAIFASDVANMTAELPDGVPSRPITGRDNIAIELFVGGTVDILCQYVPKGTPFVNPFNNKDEDAGKIFDTDKIIHHVIRLTLGEVGQDKYLVRIRG